MQSEERKLVKENQEMEKKIKAGLTKEWKVKTVSLEGAAGLRLVKSYNNGESIELTWSDGRRTFLDIKHVESYGDSWTTIEENEERSYLFMKETGMLDKKALDYIYEVHGKIAANDKKLKKFMMERQLEQYKKELEALDG